MQDPGLKRGIRLIVRDPAHIALLLGEGVNLDARGVLQSLDRFWDFTPRCVLEYENRRAAAAAPVVAPSDDDSDLSSLPDEELTHSNDSDGELSSLPDEELTHSNDSDGELSSLPDEELTHSNDSDGELSSLSDEELTHSNDSDGELSSLPDEELTHSNEAAIYSSSEPQHEGHKAAQEIAGDGTVVETHLDCARAPQAERGVSVEKVWIDIHYSISG
jgi:hypothetical protein